MSSFDLLIKQTDLIRHFIILRTAAKIKRFAASDFCSGIGIGQSDHPNFVVKRRGHIHNGLTLTAFNTEVTIVGTRTNDRAFFEVRLDIDAMIASESDGRLLATRHIQDREVLEFARE